MSDQKIVDSCYFCTTPFQVIGALTLAMQKKEISDLYIIGQFATYEETARNIEKEGIFRKVISVDQNRFAGIKDVKPAPLKWLKILFWYLQCEKISKSIIYDNARYRIMYFTSQTLVSRLVRLYFMRKHPETIFYQIDEGVGSYFQSKVFKLRKLDKAARIFLFGKASLEMNIKKMLYMPQLSQWINEDDMKNQVEQMPYVNTEPENVRLFNRVFGFYPNNSIEERVVFFDTLREQIYTGEGIDVLTDYINIVADAFGRDNVIVKSHPRSEYDYNLKLKKYENQSMPSEIIYMNMDIDNKILVSDFSTACVTPKILFNKEPVVILLYKLMSAYHNVDESADNFFQRLKQTYKQPERFMIPVNKEELVRGLNVLQLR